MKITKVPNSFLEIAHTIGKVPVLKFFFRPFYNAFIERVKKSKSKQFCKIAQILLKDFDACMQENDIPYMLMFGTLLGAVREKGFIRHDVDADVALFYEDRPDNIVELLKQKGFTLQHSFEIDGGKYGCEETYTYKNTGATIDCFYLYPRIDEYPYGCTFQPMEGCATWESSMKKYGGVLPKRIEMPIDKRIIRVPFEDFEVSIPANYNQILEFCYGEGYMIPDPNYVPMKEHRTFWIDKLGIYKNYR